MKPHHIFPLAKRLIRRLVNARKRMKLAALLATFVSILATAHIFSTTWVYPHTSLNGIPIGGFTRAQLAAVSHTLLTTPYRMRVQNREYTYTYADFGVEVDLLGLLQRVYAPNQLPFPQNILKLLQSFSTPRTLTLPLVFTQQYDRFIEQTTYQFGDSTNEVTFDQEDKMLTVIEQEESYRIEDGSFKQLLVSRIGNASIPLYPKLAKIDNPQTEALEDVAQRIKKMFLSPLTVYVDSSGVTRSFIITERELADMSTVLWEERTTDRFIDIHTDTAIRILNEHVKQAKFPSRGNIVSPKVIKDLEDALLSRFNGHAVDAIKIYYDSGPNSDGRLASKYIEVDISQQKMYTFSNGKLLKEYRVSTGLDYPTPVGEFTILNKTGLGFSTIYNVWMAWWMGFKYSEEHHAYFGIHELPYTITDGSKIHRPVSNIGTPSTGGCVALGVGDAQQVYRFADIGTKVVIYK